MSTDLPEVTAAEEGHVGDASVHLPPGGGSERGAETVRTAPVGPEPYAPSLTGQRRSTSLVGPSATEG